MVERVAWVDAPSGASAGLLLAALVDAGVPTGVMAEAIEKVATGARLREERVQREGVAATCCQVDVEDMSEPRTWPATELLLAGAGLHEDVRSLAHDVFARLAETESDAQGVPVEDVHFDVASPQALAEVVGVCAGVVHLEILRLVVAPGAVVLEQSSPVGAALLTALADDWGAQPSMTVSGGGTGAECEPGGPALVRLSTGEAEPRHPESLGEG
jgi:pyridinium-3,5-bisthiocarboxylic acid mononucleotide nickel chelatase